MESTNLHMNTLKQKNVKRTILSIQMKMRNPWNF